MLTQVFTPQRQNPVLPIQYVITSICETGNMIDQWMGCITLDELSDKVAEMRQQAESLGFEAIRVMVDLAFPFTGTKH